MLEIFTFGFMQRAFLTAILISIIAPCIGVVIVLKRLSTIGDATSHSALAGIAFGLMIGINPVVGAILFSLLAVLSIEGFRKAFGKYAEISTAVIMSAGVGLTAIFSDFIKNSENINRFLFGSIVTITSFDMILTLVLGLCVVAGSILLYKELFFITFDEENARLCGVPVRGVNFVFMVLTAITVSLASKTVGALMISSLMVIPVACAMTIAKSYKQTMILSILFALAFTILGLLFAFYLGLKSAGTIVLLGVIVLVVLMTVHRRQ